MKLIELVNEEWKVTEGMLNLCLDVFDGKANPEDVFEYLPKKWFKQKKKSERILSGLVGITYLFSHPLKSYRANKILKDNRAEEIRIVREYLK